MSGAGDDRRGTPKMFAKQNFGGRGRQDPPATTDRTPVGGRQDPPIRGYIKIDSAARAFDFDFNGKTVLDIGSSTGGFTEYALDHGAKKVIAVEKGSHQMKAPLRFDPRIELHEKTDIFDFVFHDGGQAAATVCSAERKDSARAAWELLSEGHAVAVACPHIDAIVADVSFISLTKVLGYAKANLASTDTDFLVMLKPQFEATPSQLHNGVVKNDTTRREIIKGFEFWLKQNSFIIIKKHDNDLKGKTGNRERFYWLKLAISH